MPESDALESVPAPLATRQRWWWVVACLTACVIWYASWPSVRRYAVWDAPFVHEDFKADSWKSRWANVGEGSWQEVQGRVVSAGDYASYLVLRQRLVPPVAIEYTAQMATGSRPGDVSVWWCEGDPLGKDADKRPDHFPGWMIQAGAFENSACSIFRIPGQNRVANANRRLEQGRDYRFRIEFGIDTLRLWVDGTLALEHRDLLPLQSGHLALYGYYPGKSFTDVQVWLPKPPDLISPLALGDADYQAGRFQDAAASYERVASARPGTAMADDGIFRASLAYRHVGDRRLATGARARIKNVELRQRAECLGIDDLADAGQLQNAAASFTAMWQERPAVRDELRRRWQEVARQLRGKSQVGSGDDQRRWYELRETLFPEDENSAWMAARILLNTGRYQEIVTHFPAERRAFAYALLATGKARDLLAAEWSTSNERVLAYLATGELAAALQSPAMHRNMRAVILCQLGKYDEAAALTPYPALLYLGRSAELLTQPGLIPAFANQALIAAGHMAEAAGAGLPSVPGSGHDPVAMILLGRLDEAAAMGVDVSYHRLCAALVAGDLTLAAHLRPLTPVLPDPLAQQAWFGSLIGLPLVDVALGDHLALKHALEQGLTCDGRWGGRYQAIAKAVLAGPSAPAEPQLEWTVELPAWTVIVEALRAELVGDDSAALNAWRRFTTLPPQNRLLEGAGPNLGIEDCARWRIAELTRTTAP